MNYLIIGGSSGIGKSLSETLNEQGSNVFATYNQNVQPETKDNIHYSYLNVLEDELNLDFLPKELDGVVYCPGSINLKPFHRIQANSFIDDYKLQVLGAIKVLQAVLPNLKAGQTPSVVLFSTVAVQQGFNFHSQVAVSKGAIEGLTKSLAAEWAPKIRINAIAPLITNTPLAAKLLNTDDKIAANAQRHPLKKIGKPEDIAAMAAFLLSEKSSWITGQIIHVDGGMSSIK